MCIRDSHISVAFFDPAKRRDFTAVETKYRKSRTVTLKGKIRGMAFYLDEENCPIGRDPLLQRLFKTGYYHYKGGLHVSM